MHYFPERPRIQNSMRRLPTSFMRMAFWNNQKSENVRYWHPLRLSRTDVNAKMEAASRFLYMACIDGRPCDLWRSGDLGRHGLAAKCIAVDPWVNFTSTGSMKVHSSKSTWKWSGAPYKTTIIHTGAPYELSC